MSTNTNDGKDMLVLPELSNISDDIPIGETAF